VLSVAPLPLSLPEGLPIHRFSQPTLSPLHYPSPQVLPAYSILPTLPFTQAVTFPILHVSLTSYLAYHTPFFPVATSFCCMFEKFLLKHVASQDASIYTCNVTPEIFNSINPYLTRNKKFLKQISLVSNQITR
jgi:hypothetical protein